MGAIVEEWDRWRRGNEPSASALIVHGPNTDVDLVNELAQQKRLDAGELGGQAIRAVDRDYLIRPGDVVAVRRRRLHLHRRSEDNPAPSGSRTAKSRPSNPSSPAGTPSPCSLQEPGAEPRLVQIDQARLRGEHAAGKRTAAIRLNYALHSFPAQGATIHGTATLAGHWSQSKHETYVGDTRAIYRHTVHVAREDLGTDGTDKDRIDRYAQRVSENRQRRASIRHALDRTRQLGVDMPEAAPLSLHRAGRVLGTRDVSAEASPPTRDASLTLRGGEARSGQPPRRDTRLDSVLPDPPDDPVRALGPVLKERIARERWEREARRLKALRPGSNSQQQPTQAEPIRPSNQSAPPRPLPAAPPIRR